MSKSLFPYGLMGSQVLKIKAAVLEVMEKNGFEPTEDVGLAAAKDKNVWQMSFVCRETALDILNIISEELGSGFALRLAWAKNGIAVTVEAPDTAFMALAGITRPEIPAEGEKPADNSSGVSKKNEHVEPESILPRTDAV